jgi:hypothetical protein
LLAQKRREEIMMNKVRQLYDSIKWPAASQWAEKIKNGDETGAYFDLFDPKAEGRIDPLGELEGFEGTAEYFVGSVWTGVTRLMTIRFGHIYASGNFVGIDVDMTFHHYDNLEAPAPSHIYNLTQTGTFRFNNENKIQTLDLVIRNVQNTVKVLSVNENTPASKQIICHTIVNIAKCDATHDPKGYYTSMEDCMYWMDNYEFGTWDNVKQNTTVCRQYHSTLAILRPTYHCPHTGKTGGGVCIPHSAADWYLHQY